MGWLEYIIVTPSHHRVHHAINKEYIDKNYAAIFIFWDKMFGTFQEEDPEIPPVYGVKKPVRTWNPFIINYQHMYQLFKDAFYTKRLWDKARIWFMPTGWRPDDVQVSHPIQIIEDVYAYEKYESNATALLVGWSWAQLIISNLLLYYMLVSLPSLGANDVLIYTIFLALSIFAYTSVMDGEHISLFAESGKFLIGLFIIIKGNWYGINEVIPFGKELIFTYLLLSLSLTVYFSYSKYSSHTYKRAY